MVVIDNSKAKKINSKNKKVSGKRTTKIPVTPVKSRANKNKKSSSFSKNPKTQKIIQHNEFASKNIKLKNIAIKLFVFEIIILFVLSAITIPASLGKTLKSSFNSVAGKIYNQSYPNMVFSIFSHNLEIATGEIVPVVGPAYFTLSAGVTSITAAYVGKAKDLSGPLIMLNLFILPDTWLELPSYAIAAAESIMLIIALLNHSFKKELKRALFVWIFIAIELFTAASIESGVLKLAKTPILALALWIPTLIIVSIFIMIANKEGFFKIIPINNQSKTSRNRKTRIASTI